MGLLALVGPEHVEPRSFTQFELIGFFGLARANESLPVGTARNVLDVSPVTVGQAKIFSEVLHMAVWTFYVESSLQHGWAWRLFK